MSEILKPVEYKEVDGPLIFLAGPIKGAPDWQSHAIEMIEGGGVHVASPRGFKGLKKGSEFTEQDYIDQVEWEHHYLDYAAKNGVTLFWLPREEKHFCERAYAQTSRFELGEAVMKHKYEGARLVVGFEEGFPNEKYLRKTIEVKFPKIPIKDTLKEACEEALVLAKL